MKKIKFILFPAVLAFAAACVEKEAAAPVEPETETMTIALDVAPETRTFIASDGNVAWNSADYVYVFDDSEDVKDADGNFVASNRHVFVQKKDADGNIVKGRFECASWPSGRTPKYVLFDRMSADAEAAESYKPANVRIIYNHETHGDNIIAVLQDKQHVGNVNSFGGSSNMAVAKVVDNNGSYSAVLQNVCGLVKFTLGEKPASVTFKGNGGEVIAGGRIRVCFNEDGTPFWKTVSSDGARQITMTANDNIWSATNEFYLCVLPQTLENGFALEVETADGETYTKTGANALTITRNKVVDLGNISKANADVEEEEDIPANALVVDLPMTADALPSDFPTSLETSGIGGEKSFGFTVGGKTYAFAFDSDAAGQNQTSTQTEAAKPGYYFNADKNLFVLGSTYGYIKFPAVENMRLYSVSVSVVNDTETGANPVKACQIFKNHCTAKVSDAEFLSDIDGSTPIYLAAVQNTGDGKANPDWKGPDYTWKFPAGENGTAANTSYCFQSRNGQVWLAKLKLVYVPAE